MAEIHVGDIGTAIVVTIKDEQANIVDLTDATEKKIYFFKPDKTLLTRTATTSGAATGGVVYYTFASGELDLAGTWKSQTRVTFESGRWYSSQFSFPVVSNLDLC